MHAMGTCWRAKTADILAHVRGADAVPFELGIPRVYSVLKLDERATAARRSRTRSRRCGAGWTPEPPKRRGESNPHRGLGSDRLTIEERRRGPGKSNRSGRWISLGSVLAPRLALFWLPRRSPRAGDDAARRRGRGDVRPVGHPANVSTSPVADQLARVHPPPHRRGQSKPTIKAALVQEYGTRVPAVPKGQVRRRRVALWGAGA